ncbi:hypothetical protein MT521_001241 [Listeria monocytogenes]|nr:hypothetical protein [Listeria monocytogenes]HAK1145622.1 hypothetical protein [Listeria monocytogenes]
MLKKTKKILNEIKTIIQQKPFDYEKAEDLISELNLEEALLDDSYHLTIIRSLRVLEDCINQANKEMIKSSTKNLLERDIPISVKEAAEIVLEKLKRE